MNAKEMIILVKKIYKEQSWNEEGNWDNVGLRFEDKNREIGDICEYSRNNVESEDRRDFANYGTEEYFELEEMDGTSSWDMGDKATYDFLMEYTDGKEEKDCRELFDAKHCYVIASNSNSQTQLNGVIDYGELVIKDAVVIAKIF